MKLAILSLAAALPLALLACKPAEPPAVAAPTAPMPPMSEAPPAPVTAPTMHVMYDAAQLQWGDAPPAFERGAQAVVLSGDPGKAEYFILRLKAPPGYKVATHWHPTDELVTLLEGDVTLKMDANAPGEHAHTFAPGGFVVLPATMLHEATTKNGMVVQVEGMGPFELTYADPNDDPRKRAAQE